METTIASNISIIKAYFKALDKKDVETASSFWADNHLFHFPSNGQGMNKEMRKGMSQAFGSAFPDLQHTIDDYVETGNKIAIRGSFTGTQNGTFNGIPPTGKSVRVGFTGIAEINNEGKVANEWVDMDLAGLLQQLGVIPS